MPADFTGTLQPVYTVRAAPDEDVQIGLIPQGESPVKLSLVLQDHASLTQALISEPEGAILAIHMRRQEAAKIVSEVRRFFVAMGWPPP